MRIDCRAALFAVILACLVGCDGSHVTRPSIAPGLVVQDLAVGTGAVADRRDTLSVYFLGWLTDSTLVTGSTRHPFVFELGTGQVIRGWDLGLPGMRVGGTRRLVVPPEYAYGDQGAGGVIPPDATLVFEVTLLEARAPR